MKTELLNSNLIWVPLARSCQSKWRSRRSTVVLQPGSERPWILSDLDTMTLIPCSLRIIGISPMEWFEPSKITIFEGSVFLGLDNCGKSSHLQITLPTTNIVPEKWRLKDYFPIAKVTVQGLCKASGGFIRIFSWGLKCSYTITYSYN